jgi:adenylate cyclase
VLEGSVRRIGNDVRVNAQLIDTKTGAHLWADRFDSNLTDLGQLQNEITGRIASSLNVELIEAESRRSLQEHAARPDAVDLTMRGLAVWWRPRSKENNKEARALFAQALQLDPQYPDALAGLAVTYATASVTLSAKLRRSSSGRPRMPRRRPSRSTRTTPWRTTRVASP